MFNVYLLILCTFSKHSTVFIQLLFMLRVFINSRKKKTLYQPEKVKWKTSNWDQKVKSIISSIHISNYFTKYLNIGKTSHSKSTNGTNIHEFESIHMYMMTCDDENVFKSEWIEFIIFCVLLQNRKISI